MVGRLWRQHHTPHRILGFLMKAITKAACEVFLREINVFNRACLKLCEYYNFLPVNKRTAALPSRQRYMLKPSRSALLWFVWFGFNGMRLTGGGSWLNHWECLLMVERFILEMKLDPRCIGNLSFSLFYLPLSVFSVFPKVCFNVSQWMKLLRKCVFTARYYQLDILNRLTKG